MTEITTTTPAIEAGWVVRRDVYPQLIAGQVQHVHDDNGQLMAVVVGKQTATSEWMVYHVPANTLVAATVDFPSHAEVGAAMARRYLLQNARIREQEQEAMRLRTEREEFGEQVRDLAIEKAKELGWCTPGLNEALRELGLRPKTMRYKVPVSISQTIYIEVEAEDEADAWTEVDGMSGRTIAHEADDYDWSVDMPSESQIKAVED